MNNERSEHPQECPITHRPFFMVIEHLERGEVATYGGPFDSYTIPERDDDDLLCCERYDHDAGWWVEGSEVIGLAVIPDDELNTLRAQLAAANEKLERVRGLPVYLVWSEFDGLRTEIAAEHDKENGWISAADLERVIGSPTE